MGRCGASLLLAVVLLNTAATSLGNPVGSSANGTEADYFEDALEKWLENFDTYTFLVEQDVDNSVADDGGGGELVPDEPSVFTDEEGEEEEEEDYDQGSSAPITLNVRQGNGLLDPNIDYKVILESLVAEEGSVLVTLGSFENKTTCGVGGFSLPSEAEGRDVPEGRLNISHHQYGNRSTTFVAFAVDVEEDTSDENSTTWTLGDQGSSEWEDQSHNLWWAMGRLAGGEQLTLIFTPPVCGCLTLKSYYALPLGENLTLVVGPEAYPSDLEKLICVDPSLNSIQENLIEDERDDEGPGHDVARSFTLHQEEEEEEEEEGGERDVEEDEDVELERSGSRRKIGGRRGGRWEARRKAKIQKKKNRQKARQTIRKAGRKVTRRKVRRHMRLQRRDDAAEDHVEESKISGEDSAQDGVQDGLQDGGHGGKWARKQARKAARKKGRKERTWKGKKPWRKHRKHRRRNGHKNKHSKHGRRRGRFHPSRNATEGVTKTPEEGGHHQPEGGDLEGDHRLVNDTQLSQTDEDALIDILLAEGEEEEEGEGEVEGEGEGEEGEPEVEEEDAEGTSSSSSSSSSSSVSRRGRKQRRQKGRKAARKWRRRKTGKGGKFCCKQGIKYKKSKLLLNNTTGEDQPDEAEVPCNEVNDVIFTYAQHQFSVDNQHCSKRFETCCSKFTLQLWENLKAKRAAKRAKRKQQRKAARQERRRQNRRQRRSSLAPGGGAPPPPTLTIAAADP